MQVYNSIDQLLFDLSDEPDGEYLLVQRAALLYQSINGRIPLSQNSQLGKSIFQVCSNLRFDLPNCSDGYIYLTNPNSYLCDRPVSIVDVAIHILLINRQLQLSVVDIRDSVKLYRKCESTFPTLKHSKRLTTSFL